jgi:enoyl-[acyl-carrier protein] reductase I
LGLLKDRIGLVFGVANDRSYAWHIAEACHNQGATLGFTHFPGDKMLRRVERLSTTIGADFLTPCDVQKDEDIQATFEAAKEKFGRLDFVIHSVAFANRDDLGGDFRKTSRAGFALAMDVSAYSLIPICRFAAPLMTEGGSVLALSYYGGEKVVPGYNVMGVAKAALEHTVRYLAWDLGKENIRVNTISAGPLRTLSAMAVEGFDEILDWVPKKAPLRRNIEGSEVANTAAYLLSDLASGVTGEVLHVDAGYNTVGL